MGGAPGRRVPGGIHRVVPAPVSFWREPNYSAILRTRRSAAAI